MKKWRIYATYIILTLLVGFFSALLTMGSMKEYATLIKPTIAPPAWLFPIAWTILYILMAIGGATYHIKAKMISGLFVIQLIVNFFWPIIFFNFRAYLFAFIWLLLLLILVILMTIQFYKVDKVSGLIQIPYILWLCFAGVLNFMVYSYYLDYAPGEPGV